ncbi:MAG: hypothetical protein COA79_24855 [Planctomycetota bacterium]|nr:MAG: hypothetical protein COA79_24855 [Planctomycetota bacterium]
MSGEIKKVTSKGVKIEDKELGVIIDISWSNISKKSTKYLKRKYSIKEKAQPKVVEENENENENENEVVVEKEPDVKAIRVNVRTLGKKFFTSYIALVKESINHIANGFDVELAKGLKLHMKKGYEITGLFLSEDDKSFSLLVKGRTKKISKDLVNSSREIKIIKRGGSIGFTEDNKKVGQDLHLKILKAVADDIGISRKSAKGVFAKRLSGGFIDDGRYQGKYNSYSYKSSVDLGKNSFLFTGTKGKEIMEKLKLEWWGKVSLKEKENIYMGIYILNKLPKYKYISRRCAKCKGKGHLKRPKYKNDKNDKKKKDRKTTKEKEAEKLANACPDCKGLKKLYSIQYE